MEDKEYIQQLEQRLKALEDAKKAEMDAAEKAKRDEKYRLSMLGHENMRWDFSPAMQLLPSDPNLNDIRLQQAGKNTWLNFDRWGINPDFIKRFPNKCVGSGFEWYNPANGKPYFWVTDGRVTDASNWEGTVALELKPGQKAEQGTLYPVHRGSQAGADPAWWDNYQTRVSFKHKGGAVRVRVKPYPEQGWSWDESERPVFYSPGWGSHGSYAKCRNGDIIAVSGYGTYLRQAYCESLDVFLTQNNSLTDEIPLFEGSSEVRGVVFNDNKNNLYLGMARMRNAASGDKQQVHLYKSVSGNGKDSEGNADWELYSIVRESEVSQSLVMQTNMPLGAPLILPSGRWVWPCVYFIIGTNFHCRAAIYTSDDEGLTWTHRTNKGNEYTECQSRTIASHGGRLWWVVGSMGHIWYSDNFYYSADGGETWTSAYNKYFPGASAGHQGALYTYAGKLWYMGVCYEGRLRIFNTTDPMNPNAWQLIYGASNFGGTAFTKYFPDEQERVWCVGNRIIGRRVVDPTPLTLIDNSEEGLIDKYGNEVGVIKEGEYLDYDYIENWAFLEPPAPDNPNVPYLVTGYHTFYFQPIEGQGKLKICFENVDDQGRACYIDAVQIEPDFTGKWPSLYTQGPRSVSPIDVIGMPGIGTPEWDEGSGTSEQTPTEHASTHRRGAVDELTPEDIGAETPAGAQAKADQAEGKANAYADGEIAALDGIYLNKANEEEYTPTADYHPATKQYVDTKETVWPPFMEQDKDGLKIYDSPEKEHLKAIVGRKGTLYDVYTEIGEDFATGTLDGVVAGDEGLELAEIGAVPVLHEIEGTNPTSDGSYRLPFQTYYKHRRTQYVLLASEIEAMGFKAGNKILGLELKCGSSLPGLDLTNFRIHLKNTTLGVSQGWVVEGWTVVFGPETVYKADITVNEWVRFDFTEPFVWDGTNLLINITVEHSSYSNSGSNFVLSPTVNRQCGWRADSGSYPYDNVSPTVENYILQTRLLRSEYETSGSRTSPPLDLSSLGTNPDLRAAWQADEPEGTGVKVFTAVTDEIEITDEELGTGDGIRDTFYLEHYPVENDLVVYVDGAPTAEYRLDPGDPRKIVFPFDCVVFGETGNHKFIVPADVTEVDVLVVAGGGGGGGAGSDARGAGGGGAGGVIYHKGYSVSPEQEITVTVGAGGAGGVGVNDGQNGQNSVFGELVAVGGGGGAKGQRGTTNKGLDGGSGGGGTPDNGAGGAATAGQGYAGGKGGPASGNYTGGGGGGAGSAGVDGTSTIAGDGGSGVDYSAEFGIDYGVAGVFAGGGGGGGDGGTAGKGSAGGGDGHVSIGNGTDAIDGTGSGGGGAGTSSAAGTNNGGRGGRGIVIIKWGGSDHRPQQGEVVTVDYTGVGNPEEPRGDIFTLYLGGATGGTFTLTDGATDTDPIDYDCTAEDIQTALEDLYGEGKVTVETDTDLTIAFVPAVGDSGLTADFTNLSGATDPALTLDTAYDPGDWEEQANGELITNIPEGDLTGKHLWLREKLSTADNSVTPILTQVLIYYGTEEYDIFTNRYLRSYSGDALPTASEDYRGQIFTVTGSTGVADKSYLCVKGSEDDYEWKELYFVVEG